MSGTPGLKQRLAVNLQRHDRTTLPLARRRPAAVAVAVAVDARIGPVFLLTKRATGLRSHQGQFALPGGRIDPGEEAEEAAQRELFEELAVGDSEVLGVLDDYATRSGYVMTPVVVWVGDDPVIEPNPAEVAAVHRIPLTELERSDAPQFLDTGDPHRPVVFMPLLGGRIFAPTAAVLYQFREVALSGRTTRVAHLDQPPFAWR